ncbi:MAG: alanine racemase [Clostridiales bacterium]
MSGKITTTAELIRSAWIDDQQALRANLARIRGFVGAGRQIMAVVKADAYGHGAVRVAAVLAEAGADQFAVATVEEGIELRLSGIEQPILVLGPVLGAVQIGLAIRYQLAQAIFSLTQAAIVAQTAGELDCAATIFIKLNTGMNRLGFAVNQTALEQVVQIFNLPHLQIAGIFSHFAEADSPGEFTAVQLQTFNSFIDQCRKRGLVFPLRHIANSAAIIAYPETYLDMVRPGIILYGCQPSDDVYDDGFQPVLSVKAQIAQIHPIAAGEGAGYGRQRRVERPSLIADIPVGYADGIPRLIGDRGYVLIGGKRAPLAGRVCMDQILADITDIPGVQVGDEAVMIGSQGTERISADLFASWAQTISYEVLTHLSLRLDKIYR